MKIIQSALFLIVMQTNAEWIDIPKEIIGKYLPENPIILEAGMHVGTDTMEMCALWPKCTIYGFEPVPSLYEACKKIEKAYNNVFVFPYALSNVQGFETFYVSTGKFDASSSLLEPTGHKTLLPFVQFDKTIVVQTITIDDWAKQNAIERIDLLWLDLQGSECPVLKASPRILSTVKVILTEVSHVELYKNQVLYPEYKAWLEENGFFLVYQRYSPTQGNALFIRK